MDPPKAWIFQSSKETKVQSSHIVDTDFNALAMRSDQQPSNSPADLIYSSLALGNSDPFGTYAISIGPRESHSLQVYQRFVVPCLYKSRTPELVNLVILAERQSNITFLQDEATAYALLAREAALESLLSLRGRHVAPSTSSLIYTTKCQAVLRKRLSQINGTETPETVVIILCTILRLTAADAMTASSYAHLHIQAIRRLLARYTELVGTNFDRRVIMDLLALVYVDVSQALLRSTTPMLELNDWLPYLNQDHKDASGMFQPSELITETLDIGTVHTDVKDEMLRTLIRNQRGTLFRYHQSLEGKLDPQAAGLLSAALDKDILQIVQLLHIISETEAYSQTELSPEPLEDQTARVYIPLSVLLWSHLALPTSVVINLLVDVAYPTLRRLRNALLKSKPDQKTYLCGYTAFAHARLWALSVGVHTELHRARVLGLNMVCGYWFLDTFREEADALGVHSWQHAASIFKQFLYSDHLEPHLSQWWDEVASPHGSPIAKLKMFSDGSPVGVKTDC